MDAAAGALRRTIPDTFHRLQLGAVDLSSLPATAGAAVTADATKAHLYDLRGCWITIQNKTGAAIYVARGPSSVALPSSSAGESIEDGAKEEFYVDERDEAGHFLRASAVDLLIGFDSAMAKAL